MAILDFVNFNGARLDLQDSALTAYVRDMSPVATVGPADMVYVDDAAPLTADGLVVSVEPVQTGSGDPSPTNVRPITGWDGVTVTDEGKNLLEVTATTQTVNGVTYTVNDDGTIRISGTPTANYGSYAISYVTLPAGDYKVNGFDVGSQQGNRLILTNNLTGVELARVFNGADVSFSLSEETTIKVFPIILVSDGAINTVVKPMIRYASDTNATFTPYVPPRTASVDFGQTLYGGTVDLATGECVVDRVCVTLDGVNGGTYKSNGRNEVAQHGFVNVTGKAYGIANIISDRFRRIQAGDPPDFYGRMLGRSNSNGIEFSLPLDVQDTTPSVIAWFAANQPQLCFELANPTTFTLTPAELALFKGTNNILADAGQVTVTYRQDVFLALNKRINELQALVLES